MGRSTAASRKTPATPLPATFAPELATLARQAPTSPDEWIFEVKFDGYRMLARVDQGVQLISRNGKDWTAKLEPLRAELERMALPRGWYDGEIVVHDSKGRPDFSLLQNAFDHKRANSIDYYLFDAPYLDGEDLREMPLTRRRQLLHNVLLGRASDKVRFSAALDAPPEDMIVAACQMGLEGLIGKRKDSVYVSRRSPEWIKLKCGQRQEFVVGGYTDPAGARNGFGALLLGTYDPQGRLVYAGSVGTGFDEKALRSIYKRLVPLGTDQRPFAPHKELRKPSHWVTPQLVAEVSFAEWTHTGSIRHASFRGLRTDKPAAAIVREQAAEAPEAGTGPFRKHRWGNSSSAPPKASTKPVSTVKVTNGDRIVDATSGATKQAVVDYYAAVADLMLPHLAGRPTSLVRAPAGIGGELFFQKHAESAKLAGMQRFPADIHPGHPPMLEIATADGLLATAQWNVVEYHTQNALGTLYERPDRLIFDLDPGEGIVWQQLQEAATLVRAALEHLGLSCFLKTSGGKGLHIDVPIQPVYGWDAVKALSKTIVVHIAKVLPERFSPKSGPANRKQKIFIDYLRNGKGATTACAWSARARPGLGISVPVAWEELQTLRGGDHWTIGNFTGRLAIGNSPWDGYRAAATKLDETFEMLEVRRPRR